MCEHMRVFLCTSALGFLEAPQYVEHLISRAMNLCIYANAPSALFFFNEREVQSDGEWMRPEQAGNVRASARREVTYSRAMKQEENLLMRKTADGLAVAWTRIATQRPSSPPSSPSNHLFMCSAFSHLVTAAVRPKSDV